MMLVWFKHGGCTLMPADGHLAFAVKMAIRNSGPVTADPREPETTELAEIVGMSWIEMRNAPATTVPVDHYSTEEHGDHLRSEAVDERRFSLRPACLAVK
jgi:hypothetical protein